MKCFYRIMKNFHMNKEKQSSRADLLRPLTPPYIPFEIYISNRRFELLCSSHIPVLRLLPTSCSSLLLRQIYLFSKPIGNLFLGAVTIILRCCAGNGKSVKNRRARASFSNAACGKAVFPYDRLKVFKLPEHFDHLFYSLFYHEIVVFLLSSHFLKANKTKIRDEPDFCRVLPSNYISKIGQNKFFPIYKKSRKENRTGAA